MPTKTAVRNAGSPLAADGLQGLCPGCLLRRALEPQSLASDGGEGDRHQFVRTETGAPEGCSGTKGACPLFRDLPPAHPRRTGPAVPRA